MKKLLMFLCCICALNLFAVSETKAKEQKCIPAACPSLMPKLQVGPGTEYIRAYSDPKHNQCYSCDSDDGAFSEGQECGYGTIVAQRDENDEIVDLYQCSDVYGPVDAWRNVSPKGHVCPGSIFKSEPATNGKVRYLKQGSRDSVSSKWGDNIVTVSGSDGCVYYDCNDGFVPNEDKTDCVATNSLCKDVGGKYHRNDAKVNIQCEKDESSITGSLADNGALRNLDNVITGNPPKCWATCQTNGWYITLQSDGCATNYKPSEDAKECIMTDDYAKQLKDEQEREAQAKAQVAKDKCENSGGRWENGQCECATQKHLVPKEPGKTCNCVNGYRLQNKVCILTDAEKMKRACKEINKPYLELGNTCDCSSDGYMFEFVLGKGCVLNSAYAACISDAAVASGARWKDGSKKCGCGDKEPDYYWNIEQELCVKSEKLINQENANQITAKVSELDANITKGLDGWQKTLSVWKTEEGKFNTARLASDSIAGVVLGTAGGLITSKVVKKNQVKSGFEDIECTVGGQKVADWHDEFTVGVQ